MTSRILQGSVFNVLPTLDAESVQMCVTSPPYWGLRDYGVEGQLGLESTPEEYVAKMVDVFREVRRVLKDAGTLWLNLGDSYAGSSGGDTKSGFNARYFGTDIALSKQGDPRGLLNGRQGHGLKPKDLIGIPWRVAFALQADGWFLRQDIIWHKPNPMPESVTDRCTKAHEYLFLLSKSARYWFDAEAIAEKRTWAGHERTVFDNACQDGAIQPGKSRHSDSLREFGTSKNNPEQRNKRSVWTVNSQPYAEAHFATFPPRLIEPCILAGSRPGDVVLDPFFGSGTTGEVCERLGRQWLGIELNPEYAAMAQRRTAQQGFCFE